MSNALKEYYSRKSTEELEEIIRLDVDSDEADGLDPEALDAILEVLQDRNYAEEYIKKSTTWEDFEKYYLPGLEERKPGKNTDECISSDDGIKPLPKLSPSAPGSTKKKNRFWSGHTLKVASIAVAISLVFFSVVSISAAAAGYNLWDAVARWTSETFRFGNGDGARLTIPTADDYSGEYRNLESALEAHGVDVKLAPTWLPDDYRLTVISIIERTNRTIFTAEYCNSNDDIVIVTLTQHDTSTPSFAFQEKDRENISIYKNGNIEHYIFSNLESTTITWINSGFECSVYGKFAATDAHTIIDSIYER